MSNQDLVVLLASVIAARDEQGICVAILGQSLEYLGSSASKCLHHR